MIRPTRPWANVSCRSRARRWRKSRLVNAAICEDAPPMDEGSAWILLHHLFLSLPVVLEPADIALEYQYSISTLSKDNAGSDIVILTLMNSLSEQTMRRSCEGSRLRSREHVTPLA